MVAADTHSRTASLSNGTFGFLLTLPAVVLFGAIVLYPLIGSLTTSLFEQSLVAPGRAFVGLDNFRHVLDNEFWPVLQNTLVFTVAATRGAVPHRVRAGAGAQHEDARAGRSCAARSCSPG